MPLDECRYQLPLYDRARADPEAGDHVQVPVISSTVLEIDQTAHRDHRSVVCAEFKFKLCTDNGAMIAMSGLINFQNGRRDDWDLDVIPSLRIGTSSIV